MNLSKNLDVREINGAPILDRDFRTLYVVPGKLVLAVRLSERRSDGSYTFSLSRQEVELDAKAGQTVYLCGSIVGKQWRVAAAPDAFACR